MPDKKIPVGIPVGVPVNWLFSATRLFLPMLRMPVVSWSKILGFIWSVPIVAVVVVELPNLMPCFRCEKSQPLRTSSLRASKASIPKQEAGSVVGT